MKARRFHRILGIVMVLPLACWAATGLVFFIKPGYSAAYEALAPRLYPIEGEPGERGWMGEPHDALEIRRVRTILGEHLLERRPEGWGQLEPRTLGTRAAPSEREVSTLLEDAVSTNPARYGRIARVTRGDEDGRFEAVTDTGVRLTLDWNSLSISQRGADTDLIDLLYRIHYLQWTDIGAVDRILGGAGIILVFGLTALGLKLFFRP